jgi:hypothetical protein
MASAHWKEGLLLKTANVLACILLLGPSTYAFVLSPRPIYDNIKQTYLTPAYWAFFAWPVIHFLISTTAIYQFTSAHAKVVVVDRISWRLPTLAILNLIFVTVWADPTHQHPIAAFFLSIFIFSTLRDIISNFKITGRLGDNLFVFLPIFAWHGWSAVMVAMTAFEAFGLDATKESAGTGSDLLVLFAMNGLMSTGVELAVLSPGCPLVISWTLWAIYAHQESSTLIHWGALLFTVVSLPPSLLSVLFLYIRCSGNRTPLVDEECDPLLAPSS